jgi:single-stranded-DNA-specific exonuclease
MNHSIEHIREKIILRPYDKVLAAMLAQELSVPLVIGQILTQRGFTTVDECASFFDPQLTQLHAPFLFIDMEKAVDRIMNAIGGKERISVYGDYDVDGITATAIMLKAIEQLGGDCDYYLPNRLTEGYGMSIEGVRALSESGSKLIITVDCGIHAHEEVELAKSLGIDVIITDHHEPKDTLPKAFALLNPKIASCGYPDKALAGVGVALKLCHALAIKNNKPDSFWTNLLDFAAVGTAADIVPLTGENRVIAKFGFDRLEHTENPGLRALINEQGLSGKPLSTREVGFQIAPCMNAVGRLGDPRRGVELLMTKDPAVASRIARELKETNFERRAIDKAMQEEVFAWIERHWDPQEDYAIVMAKENWHCGVIGIVASKVVERYHRPALLFSISDGVARGSGRSIAALHLHDALTECKDLLETFGGHAAAAGMTILSHNLDTFRLQFNSVVKARVSLDSLAPQIPADGVIALKECGYPLYNAIKRMEPFGAGNARPLFLCRDLKNKFDPRIVGEKHLKLMVVHNGTAMDAIAFNLGDRFDEVKKAKNFSLVFSLDENEWNGRKSLQLKVRGVEV